MMPSENSAAAAATSPTTTAVGNKGAATNAVSPCTKGEGGDTKSVSILLQLPCAYKSPLFWANLRNLLLTNWKKLQNIAHRNRSFSRYDKLILSFSGALSPPLVGFKSTMMEQSIKILWWTGINCDLSCGSYWLIIINLMDRVIDLFITMDCFASIHNKFIWARLSNQL